MQRSWRRAGDESPLSCLRTSAAITVGFYLSDTADSILTTIVLLDKFRWDYSGYTPSDIGDCGVQLP